MVANQKLKKERQSDARKPTSLAKEVPKTTREVDFMGWDWVTSQSSPLVVPTLAKAFKRSHDRSMRYRRRRGRPRWNGSAILAHCAGRGSAIGLEQFERNHQFGSSSGKKSPDPQSLFRGSGLRSVAPARYEMWRDLERQTRRDLLRITGLLMVGAESRNYQRCPKGSPKHHLLLRF